MSLASGSVELELQRLATLFEGAPSFVALFAADGAILYANAAFKHVFADKALSAQLASRQILDQVAAGESLDDARALAVEDGASITFKARWTPYLAEGERLGALCQGVDLTGEASAQAQARRLQRLFTAQAETIPNLLWTCTPQGELDWFNDQVYAYANIPKGSLDGEKWISIVHPDDVASSLERMAVALATGTTQPNEFRLRRHDGEYRWHIVRAVPIRDETGAIEKWIGSNTDIHDQKMAQAALADYAARLEREVEARAARLRETEEALRHAQKMETIGNFAGGIAHDFNNLLQIIGSSLHLARYARPGDPKVAERIDGAVEAVRRAGRLTSQLLAFGRRQLLQPRPVRPAELLSGMDKILRGALGPEVNLTVDVAPDARQVLADPGNIENAILNLVLNARDAMPRGGALGVRVSNFAATDAGSLKPGEYVRIDVSDSGDGMSEATQEKIFEPFFSTKPIGQGSGMGLSMVYGFAQQSGGGVSVVSALGKGSVFSLFLPATDVIDNILSEPKAAASTRGRGETILVVDDEKAIRDTTISLLTNLGYRVMAAHDAAGALAALRSGVAFDLVVSDVVMPGPLTVEALLNELARSYPAIPVLLASGYPRDVLVSERGIAPDIEVIAKPYEEQRLAGAVRAALDRARAIEKPALEQPTTAADVFRVLVCEDQSFIRFDLMEAAQELGCEVIEAGNIETARDLLSTAPVDLLLTDIHLPDGSGVDVAMAARKIRPQMPVIFVTADPLAAPAGFARATLVQKPFTPRDLRRALANWLPAAMAEKGRRTEGD